MSSPATSTSRREVGRLVKWTGRLFSSPKNLLIGLLIYGCVWGVTLTWLYVKFSNFNEASFVAYEIATGGDPYNFKELRQDPWLWNFLAFVHILSWLIVPILIAAVIDSTYHRFEEEKLRAGRRLRQRIRNIGKARLGLSGDELDAFVEEEFENMQLEEGDT